MTLSPTMSSNPSFTITRKEKKEEGKEQGRRREKKGSASSCHLLLHFRIFDAEAHQIRGERKT